MLKLKGINSYRKLEYVSAIGADCGGRADEHNGVGRWIPRCAKYGGAVMVSEDGTEHIFAVGKDVQFPAGQLYGLDQAVIVCVGRSTCFPSASGVVKGKGSVAIPPVGPGTRTRLRLVGGGWPNH